MYVCMFSKALSLEGKTLAIANSSITLYVHVYIHMYVYILYASHKKCCRSVCLLDSV